ncbi:hypothetical protein CR513_48430, partial [Mucuna pruriens]
MVPVLARMISSDRDVFNARMPSISTLVGQDDSDLVSISALTGRDAFGWPRRIRSRSPLKWFWDPSENPHKHLKEFHVICSTMRSHGIPKHYIKMKTFPFSLDGVEKDWLYMKLALNNTSKKIELDDELLQTFKKMEINIPLLDVIKQILKYAKGDVEIQRNVSTLIKSEQVYAMIQPVMLMKCRNPNTFTIPCTIGECTFVDVVLDLSAQINVMSSSPTSVIIQLANKSIAYQLGFLEDVLVHVYKLIFPTNFSVLDIEDESFSKGSTLILGRPFLITERTKIDVYVWTLLMEFGDNMFFILLILLTLSAPMMEMMSVPFVHNVGVEVTKVAKLERVTANQPLLPSIIQPLFLELKPLFEHLKYTYLEANQKLLVIIAKNLQSKAYRKVNGWTLLDQIGINLFICMHRIPFEEEIRLVRQL